MTKYDDGRLEDFWEFNLYLGDRFPLEIEAIVGSNLELVSAFQDSLLQRAVFQSQHDRVPLPCIAGLFPDKRPFNALIVLSLDRSIVRIKLEPWTRRNGICPIQNHYRRNL